MQDEHLRTAGLKAVLGILPRALLPQSLANHTALLFGTIFCTLVCCSVALLSLLGLVAQPLVCESLHLVAILALRTADQ